MTAPVYDVSALSNTELLFSFLDVKPSQARMTAATMPEHVMSHRIVTNRGAKVRTVFAPDDMLSWVQNRIRYGLLLKLPVEDCVHGFVHNRGIVTNAIAHVGRKAWVVNIDLKDFFPSIGHFRVRDLFQQRFALERKPASYLTRLTTFSGFLPQGFPTSPDIANIAAWGLDRRMSGLARKHGLVYTRYADDLTLSCPEDTDVSVKSIIRKVFSIVRDEGFIVNRRKIAVMRLGRRQKVTGLVVGDRGTIGVDRRLKRLLRSAVHRWPQQTPERKAQIMGLISHVHSVDPAHAAMLLADVATAPATQSPHTVPGHDFSIDVEAALGPRNRFVTKQHKDNQS